MHMRRSDASASVSVERFFEFALLGLVSSGFLAVASSRYLDAPTIALVAAALLLRALTIWGVVPLKLGERALTIAAALYAGFFLLDFFLISRDLLGATVHLAFFLVSVKVLSSRSERDHVYVAAIAVLELLAAALLSIDFNFFAGLALFVFFTIAALASSEIRRSMARGSATARGPVRFFHPRLALLSALVGIAILALTSGLFFFLPRTANAAFSHFARDLVLPGFADQVNLGEIGEIKTSSRPVMHVRMFTPDPPGALMWRGAALSDFDGRRWANVNPRKTRVPMSNGQADLGDHPRVRGLRLNYAVAFDSAESNTLFFAGLPERVDLRETRLMETEDGDYSVTGRIVPGFRYEAYTLLPAPPIAAPPRVPPPILPLSERERFMQLPAALDQRIPALARSLAGGAGSDLAKAQAIEARLRRDYGYTLKLPDSEIADPLANFLFTRKKGHCEYFASAMAVMLRTLGIPSRLATGFHGGEFNSLTGLWVVRASDAHAWVEAWMPGYGWTTFDPTPSDSEDTPGLLTQLSLYLDAGQIFWQDWVVGYNMGRQGTLAGRMEQGARRVGIRWFDAVLAVQNSWRNYKPAITRRSLVIAGAALALAICLWWIAPPLFRFALTRRRTERVRRGEAVASDATMLYARLLRILRRKGFEKPGWFTPAEFVASLPEGPLNSVVADFTEGYNAMRFGGRMEIAPRLAILLDELEQSR